MTPVFLDTVGLLALWDIADQWHDSALEAYERLAKDRRTLVTSRFVLLECGNASARRPYRTEVAQLHRTITLRGELIIPTDDDWERAWAAFESGANAHAGIVDQVSFIIMWRMGMTEAFTNDRHFQAAGFRTLF